MPTGRRPFEGFDRERAYFNRIRKRLLKTHEGKFIAIVGNKTAGLPVDTFMQAARQGLQKFGLGPVYVKQILAQDERVEST
jgi:hypothetical protein